MTIKTRNIADSAVTAAKLAANAVTAAKLSTTMATGFIDLPITAARVIAVATNEIGAIAVGGANTFGSGGIAGSDGTGATGIALARVNAATDKQTRLVFPASGTSLVQWSFVTPPDLDATAALTIKFLARMAGATDTPVLTVAYFENGAGAYAGDTNAGGNTAAVTGTSLAVYSRAIAAADVAAAPTVVTIDVIPGAHTTDALHLFGAWVEYTRV